MVGPQLRALALLGLFLLVPMVLSACFSVQRHVDMHLRPIDFLKSELAWPLPNASFYSSESWIDS